MAAGTRVAGSSLARLIGRPFISKDSFLVVLIPYSALLFLSRVYLGALVYPGIFLPGTPKLRIFLILSLGFKVILNP
jgi:hypothetical protein